MPTTIRSTIKALQDSVVSKIREMLKRSRLCDHRSPWYLLRVDQGYFGKGHFGNKTLLGHQERGKFHLDFTRMEGYSGVGKWEKCDQEIVLYFNEDKLESMDRVVCFQIIEKTIISSAEASMLLFQERTNGTS